MKLPISKEQTIAALNAWWQSGKSPNVEDCAAFISEYLNKQLAPHKWQKEREAWNAGKKIDERTIGNPHDSWKFSSNPNWDDKDLEFRVRETELSALQKKLVAEGFTPWFGGECKDKDKVVEAVFSDGSRGIFCANHEGLWSEPFPAAYRLAQPPVEIPAPVVAWTAETLPALPFQIRPKDSDLIRQAVLWCDAGSVGISSFSSKAITYKELLEKYTLADRTPCGTPAK